MGLDCLGSTPLSLLYTGFFGELYTLPCVRSWYICLLDYHSLPAWDLNYENKTLSPITLNQEQSTKKKAAQDQVVNNAYILDLLYSQVSGNPTHAMNYPVYSQ